MARGRVGRVGRRAPLRKFVWARQIVSSVVSAQDVNYIDLLGDFNAEYGADLLGATVMRLRGRLEFEPNAASTTVNAAGVRVETESFATGATSSQHGPFGEQYADWMAYEPVIFNDADPTLQIHRWEIDVKSNRKLEELSQGLYLVADNRIVGVTMNVSGIVSVGLKLP